MQTSAQDFFMFGLDWNAKKPAAQRRRLRHLGLGRLGLGDLGDGSGDDSRGWLDEATSSITDAASGTSSGSGDQHVDSAAPPGTDEGPTDTSSDGTSSLGGAVSSIGDYASQVASVAASGSSGSGSGSSSTSTSGGGATGTGGALAKPPVAAPASSHTGLIIGGAAAVVGIGVLAYLATRKKTPRRRSNPGRRRARRL